jgi:hypothetical protein
MKTVSLELAKQLKEKGYTQDAGFFYRIDKKNLADAMLIDDPFVTSRFIFCAAPTADEILDLLPKVLRLTREQTKKLIFDLSPKYQRKIEEAKIKDLDDFPADQLTFHLEISFYLEGYNFYYAQDYDFPYMINNSTEGYEKSLADAAAKMWLLLKIQKLL